MANKNTKLIQISAALLGIAFSFAGFWIYVTYGKPSGSKTALDGVNYVTNENLPAVDLIDTGGKELFPEDFRNGKVLLLYFSTNCHACDKEIEIINVNQEKLSTQVQIVGISPDSVETVQEYKLKNNIKFPIFVDSKREFGLKLKIRQVPTNYLIVNNVISKTWIGNPKNIDDLRAQLIIE